MLEDLYVLLHVFSVELHIVPDSEEFNLVLKDINGLCH